MFMVFDVVFYWFIVFTFERGVWKKLNARIFRRR